ncbi:hypothetical protein DYBT9275_02201 [Dyadobacter sp. CECT 9275]|uniref:Heparinase II/III-like C-terminal domain-containing protein n=2 Tax=Dyadobacter helix TaxID=2822344 RepID=A0A916JBS0_9BACT|nr:hypothetical protein DYBT9275_02201 [Dyadobacter sp. CECT 9275]
MVWLASLSLFFSPKIFAQQDTAKTKLPVNILASLVPGHPRLLLLRDEEKVIARQVKTRKEWRTVHEAILAECDRMMGLPPVEHIKIGRRLLDKSRECLRRVFQLSYAFRMTREEKYLHRAEKEMLAVAAFSDWNPSHFLDVAEMTLAMAIGYDWLYANLSAQARLQIREAIITKGIEPSFDKKYNGFLGSEHNWNQVCNAGMAFGALAIAEDKPQLADSVIRRGIETIPKAMLASFRPDGAYPEGYSYWDYGTGFNVLFISALEKSLGTDFGLSSMPGFLKTAGFVQNMVGPLGMVHNWGDSGLKTELNPTAFWFADRTKDPSLLYGQEEFMLSGKSNVGNRILPAVLIWGIHTDFSKIQPPKNHVWVGQGHSPVGLMRTSWTNPNAIFVGFKAGSPSVNHAHMDAGSFVLDALGERWAMDFGMQNYNSMESKGVDVFGKGQDAQRWQIFRYNNLVHNTLTVDGALQRVKGYSKIDSWSESPKQMTVTSDLSTIYEGQLASAKRGITIENSQYVVIRDEVKAPDKNVTLRWTLLTPAAVRFVSDKKIELTQNGKKMYLIFDTHAKITLKTWSTEPTHDYDAPNPGTYLTGFETEIPAGTSQTFNAYFSATEAGLKPVARLAEWPGKK